MRQQGGTTPLSLRQGEVRGASARQAWVERRPSQRHTRERAAAAWHAAAQEARRRTASRGLGSAAVAHSLAVPRADGCAPVARPRSRCSSSSSEGGAMNTKMALSGALRTCNRREAG